MNIRELALEALLEIRKTGRPMHLVTREYQDKYQYLPRQDRAFFLRLVRGTVEQHLQLEMLLNRFSSVKTGKMKPVIRENLCMALYQILYLDVPDAAAVDEAVKLAVRRGFRQLKGFVNGVLRNLVRNKEEILAELESLRNPSEKKSGEPVTDDRTVERIAFCYSMPQPLVRDWMEQYGPDPTETICRGFLRKPAVSLRLRPDCSKEEFTAMLERDGLTETVRPAPYVENAWNWNAGYSPAEWEPFAKGYLQVQDVSSMLAVLCAGIRRGDKVMDLCAAPGGKTVFAADLTGPEGSVLSGDVTEYKTDLIRENLERCGLTNVTCRVHDARVPDPELEGTMDVVLADVPCSGMGIIGRKPDIKYRLAAGTENDRKKQKEELLQLQREILDRAVSYVKPGGTLLFSTCTIDRAENLDQRNRLLDCFPLTADGLDPFLPEELRSAETAEGYLQLLPGVHACDGFFMARFIKK